MEQRPPAGGYRRDGEQWYSRNAAAAMVALESRMEGLDPAEARARQARYGPNELAAKGGKGPLAILRDQFANLMVLILIAAAVLSLGLNKFLEACAILGIVVLFGVLGFYQEYRAEKAIAALARLSMPSARVLRGGGLREVSSRDLVPGDVVAVEAGNVVPADLRLLESANLRIEEAALTGESEPVEKVTEAIDREDVPLGDRRNMAYMGTLVAHGRGTGLVVATGMRTELGTVAGLLQSVQAEATPLQRRLETVGRQLAVAGVVAAGLVFAIGAWTGEPLGDSVLSAISVAVAVIPEGLPAVVTFTLALGAQRMLRRNALIRKLPAVETLGSVTTICSDKTGTLTENRMTVTVLDLAGHRVDVHESLRRRMPQARRGDEIPELLLSRPLPISILLAAGALCNDAALQEGDDGSLRTLGDPTEGALLLAALLGGTGKADLERAMPRVAELPFDSVRKRMTTIHARARAGLSPLLQAVWGEGGVEPTRPHLAIAKGAVDGLVEIASRVWLDDHAAPLTEELRERILRANEGMARGGMRVLGVAFRPVASAEPDPGVESQMVFVGLFGMIDPPRAEVRAAVAACRTAGIRPVMITGDHPLTAVAIARDLGIAGDDRVVAGAELGTMGQAELSRAAAHASVFARVSPEHKLSIVAALQAQGQVVAMTGDGVNDAPALRKADIGVAMGITGTDVSKEAADMVLRDDNFATIVAAVEEGRVVYDNLRRFVRFAAAGNVGKVAVMLLWPLLLSAAGLPLGAAVALQPLQLLWLNLLTDGLLGLSMGAEPAERNVMRRPPHDPSAGIFSQGLGLHVLWVGLLGGASGLAAGFVSLRQNLPEWQSVVFTTLALSQMGNALAIRSSRDSLFTIGVFGNRVMWGALAVVAALQLAAVYGPLGRFLGLLPLSAGDLTLCGGLGALVFVAVEIEKAVIRDRAASRPAGAPSEEKR